MIAVGAVLAAESDLHDSYLDLFLSALITTLLFWLAHSYTYALGRRLVTHHRLTVGGLGEALVVEWPLVAGAAIPLGTLALAWATGASRATGVSAALAASVAAVIALELLAGIRARASAGELVLDACVGTALGVAILLLKVVLH